MFASIITGRQAGVVQLGKIYVVDLNVLLR